MSDSRAAEMEVINLLGQGDSRNSVELNPLDMDAYSVDFETIFQRPCCRY
jgi:hypothetical protein